jgi:hypothetical protein
MRTAIPQCLRSIRDDGATVHGFRGAFSARAWEQTDYSPEIVEVCLARSVTRQAIVA